MKTQFEILIADDDEQVKNSLRDYLSSLGHEVRAVSDGFRAIKVAGEMEFDIAVIDYRMPGLTGIEAAKEIKRMQPQIRILIMSGGLDHSKREELGRAGFDIVEKPFSFNDIKEMVIGLML